MWGCGILLLLAVVVSTTVAVTLWWVQRPITPVVLDAPEKTVLDAKLEKLADAGEKVPPQTGREPQPGSSNATLPKVADDSGRAPIEPDRPYQPGEKILRITERELNGLLNANTDLGEVVRFELGRDAINAYLALPIPEDFPIGAGKTFRAKARLKVSVGDGRDPVAILQDVTVLGISLPKAWLADIKGVNLLGDTMGEHQGKPVVRGIKRLTVEPGNLVLELEE